MLKKLHGEESVEDLDPNPNLNYNMAKIKYFVRFSCLV